MLSQYFAQVLFEWLWNGSSCPYYCCYHFCFYIPHVLISIVRLLYFRIFSVSFLITFLSPEIATSFNIHVSSSLSRIIPSGLLLGQVLLICTSWFHNTLPYLQDLFWIILVHGHTSVHCLILPLCLLLLLLLLLLYTVGCSISALRSFTEALSDFFLNVTYTYEFHLGDLDSLVIWTTHPPYSLED